MISFPSHIAGHAIVLNGRQFVRWQDTILNLVSQDLDDFDDIAIAEAIAAGFDSKKWRIDTLDRCFLKMGCRAIKGDVKTERCAYAIFDDASCVYVGQTAGTALDRFQCHLREPTNIGRHLRYYAPEFICHWIVSVEIGCEIQRRIVECALIKALNPALNVQHSPERI